MSLEKGTEEWIMFGDFFNLCKKYWNPNDSDEYWSDILIDSQLFYDKFKSYPMAKHMANALWNAQRDKLKEINSNK